MKILFVNPFYKPYLGGIERVIEKLSAEFLRSGHTVSILTTKYSFPYEYHLDWEALRQAQGEIGVFRLESWPKKPPKFYQAPLVWFSPLQIRRIVTSFRPDVVIYMGDKWFWGNLWVRIFTPQAQQIWSVVWHDLTWKKLWLAPINFVFGKTINRVVAATNLEKVKILRAYGIPENKLRVIPWGIEKSVNLKPKLFKDYLQILCVGRLARHKGQKLLTEIFIRAASNFKSPARLLLVGQDEDGTYKKIKELTKGRTDVAISLTATDAELASLYSQSDIFALFPEYESFGLVFLEAQGYGLPILTHKVGAIAEVLGKSAVIIDSYDEASATRELVKLVNDKEYRDEFCLKSREHFKSASTWGECAEEFLKGCHL